MMGMSSFVYWFSWFFKGFVYLIITLSIVVIIFQAGPNKIFDSSSSSLIFFFFLSYAVSVVAFSFLLSSFFNKGDFFFEVQRCFLLFSECEFLLLYYMIVGDILTSIYCLSVIHEICNCKEYKRSLAQVSFFDTKFCLLFIIILFVIGVTFHIFNILLQIHQTKFSQTECKLKYISVKPIQVD